MANFKRPTTVDLINNGKYANAASNTIIDTLGFTTKGDGGGGLWKKTGVTGLTASQTPAQRVTGKLNDALGHEWQLMTEGSVNIRQLGAVGDGVTDDSAAIAAAYSYAGVLVSDVASDFLDVSSYSVKWPSGRYVTTAPIVLVKAVATVGEGSGSTVLLVNHTGNGLHTTTGTFANMSVVGMAIHNIGAGTTNSGISGEGWIRNCFMFDVVINGFFRNYAFTNSWTTRLIQCSGYNAVDNHVYAGTGCGEIVIDHGRYDVAGSHGVLMDATAGELTMIGAAVQFGSAAAVKTNNARTVNLKGCFFEGNCIGNPSFYYVDLTGTSGDTLSSCVVEDCVMNNLSDVNRNGLGAIKVDHFERFEYRERWVRNGVQEIPVVGANIQSTSIHVNNASSMSVALANIAQANDNFTAVHQLARPFQYYGIDMNQGTPAPATKSTATFQSDPTDGGVSLGTWSGEGAIQSFGSPGGLQVNPDGRGYITSGAKTTRRSITSSNFTPSLITPQLISIRTTGAHNFDLSSFSPTDGGIFEFYKTDDNSQINIIPNASHSINGGTVGATKSIVAGAGTKGMYTVLGATTTDWRVSFAAEV